MYAVNWIHLKKKLRNLPNDKLEWIVSEVDNMLAPLPSLQQNITATEVVARMEAATVHMVAPLTPDAEFTMNQEQEKETTMYNLDTQQLEYFVNRLRALRDDFKTALKRQFGLLDDAEPVTAAEIVARITAGKYSIDEDRSRYSGSRFAAFIWRDPSIKTDEAGFKTAYATLESAYNLAKDAVYTAPANGAQSVAGFAAWKLA